MSVIDSTRLKEFIDELSSFANTAEETLEKIESNKDENKGLFHVFSERMFAIKGTAQQLGLPHVAEIASLGEEIAIKGEGSATRSQVRKCVGSLWDALTTVKYLLVNCEKETNEEQEILIRRLNKTLESFGGARETVGEEEIDQLLKNSQTS